MLPSSGRLPRGGKNAERTQPLVRFSSASRRLAAKEIEFLCFSCILEKQREIFRSRAAPDPGAHAHCAAPARAFTSSIMAWNSVDSISPSRSSENRQTRVAHRAPTPKV